MCHQHSADINDVRGAANQASTTATNAMEAAAKLQGQVNDINITIIKEQRGHERATKHHRNNMSTTVNHKDSDRDLQVISGGSESKTPGKDVVQQMADILNGGSAIDDIDYTVAYSDPGHIGIT
eukprot:9493845-Pyramimonas_sp.AAC.1